MGSITSRYQELLRREEQSLGPVAAGGVAILTDIAEIEDAERTVRDRLVAQGWRPDQAANCARTGIVFEDQYLRIVRDAVRFADGQLGTYIRILQAAPPGVAVLPRTNQGLLLVEHFRHATRKWHWEIPRGFGEPGVAWEENVRKELREEIGAEAGAVHGLGQLHTNTGLMDEVTELAMAELVRWGNGCRHESIRDVRALSISELDTWIADGTITDSFTIAAYTRARLRNLL